MGRYDDIPKQFGQRVRELRQELAISQEEFAARCNLDRTYISSLERGHRNVSLKNIAAIASALNVTMSELLSGLSIGEEAK